MKGAFAARLKEAMAAKGLRQAEVAERSGASRAAVSQYLAGVNVPRAERLEALAAAVGVPADMLLGGEEVPKAEKAYRITTRDAARCMGKSDQFVRVGLQRGLLPFGTAVPGKGGRWSYYISPELFREYVGGKRFDAWFEEETQ